MLKLLAVLYMFGLYVSFAYIYLCHRYYFHGLFGKIKHIKYDESILAMHRSVFVKVAPMYRKEYFGYQYFVLPELDNRILHPHRKLRVYGLIRPYSECLVLYKGDTVKTIVCLDDKRYGDKVLEHFRKTFRNVIIMISGGVILWQINLSFSIF